MEVICLIQNKKGESVQVVQGLEAMVKAYLMQNLKKSHEALIADAKSMKVNKKYKLIDTFILKELPVEDELYLTSFKDDVHEWFNKSTDLVADLVKLNIACRCEEILNIYYDGCEDKKVTKEELADWILKNMESECSEHGGAVSKMYNSWDENPLSQMDKTQIMELINYYIENYEDTSICLI